MRKFIPRPRSGKEYRGYVARSDGLHHWTEAWGQNRPDDPTAPSYLAREVYAGPTDWGELPDLKKRTERQRVDSLVRKMVGTFERLGVIPNSVMRDLQGELALRGSLWSVEDLQAMAGVYLRRAAAEEEAKERKRIVRSR